MRKKYFILWLDDEFDNDDNQMLDNIVEDIYNYICDLHFEPEIKKVNNVEDALDYCSCTPKKKIDLFISDYNIEEKTNGLDFLHNVRKIYLQDLILYSANDKDTIKTKMIDYLSNANDINFFSRFTFESLINPEELKQCIHEIIDINMHKWNELNGLRGLVLSEISLLETKMKKKILTYDKSKMKNIYSNNDVKLDSKNYKNIQGFLNGDDALLEYISFGLMKFMLIENKDSLYGEYEHIANMRNSMAHVEETYENGEPVIISLNNSSMKFHEKDIKLYRQLLFDFVNRLEIYIDNF